MPLFWFYKRAMTFGKPAIMGLLNQRMKIGKEDPERIRERYGMASLPRPNGPLMWVHVASVGEAQSMLRLIDLFLAQNPSASTLVTSITRTSAALLQQRLPPRAFHQYLPVDRPKWVARFLDHWRPDLALWAESELWPGILSEADQRHLPIALINARMSPKSFKNWSRAKGFSKKILSAFTVILTQTEQDRQSYIALGGRSVMSVGNIKFASPSLPVNAEDLAALRQATARRPLWLYASTHEGEEELAAETHIALRDAFPNLLTIVVPRHPERSVSILSVLEPYRLTISSRGQNKILPPPETDIYLADTLGELGLFYALSPISCIGRSFSKDGGGGHNPLEAAQLKSAVLHGPATQNLNDIFVPMDSCGAALKLESPTALAPALHLFLSDKEALKKLSETGYTYSKGQEQILSKVIEECEPLFLMAGLPVLKAPEKENTLS
jgi:3-deoxy-D-manno-octulosonic-acid transferase